ncbi:MAG TPA: HD domain-containing protein [Candidatus Paceibacterota bacterium]|nr:HD domain-containing protein [Candidatus Paceibacterota bacterium]
MEKELVELAALAHDVGDRKFYATEEEGEQKTITLLAESGVQSDVSEKIMDIIRKLSFKGAGVADDMPTLEGMIVQDADRLYALGAIGIARAFAYGGAKGRPIYDPEIPPENHHSKDAYYTSVSPTINHFYEKLLLLKDRMNTKTARMIAEKRHVFMQEFLDRFYAEWDAKD